MFSAIQTAFNIELYKRLTPDPDPDPILVALERISAQLSGFAVNQAFVNSTQSPFLILESTPTTPAVPLWVVVLNTLGFSSLISSLAAASIGIMVKQWLTEYKSGVSGTSRQTARLRQLRFNSLQRWRVREIVSILPVLLQIASGLFFSGLLVLLWNLNRAVAIVGTILVGILAIFSLSTIVLPSVATHCSYLSPPSRALFELVRLSCKGLYHFRLNLSTWLLGRYNATSALFYFQYGSSFGPFMRRHPVIHGVCKMLFPSDASSTLAWRGTESALVSQHTETLDGEMVATAYATSMDTNYLHHAAVCTTELTMDGTRTCLGSILAANIAHWGEGELMGPMRSVHPCMWSSALLALMSVASDDTAWSPTTLATAMKTAYDYMSSSSLHYHPDAPATRLVWVDLVRIIRHYDYNPNTLPPHSLHIAHRIYISELLAVVKTTQDMNIGNDLRQLGQFFCRFVVRLRADAPIAVSAYVDDISTGLEGTTIEDWMTLRALNILRSIIYCVPSRTGLDYKCDDVEYKRLKSQIVRALEAFSGFLSTSPRLEEHVFWIHEVLDALRQHGERADLMSAKLRQAIVRYRDAYEPPEHMRDNDQWIQKLKGELDNSGQVRMRRTCPCTPLLRFGILFLI